MERKVNTTELQGKFYTNKTKDIYYAFDTDGFYKDQKDYIMIDGVIIETNEEYGQPSCKHDLINIDNSEFNKLVEINIDEFQSAYDAIFDDIKSYFQK